MPERERRPGDERRSSTSDKPNNRNPSSANPRGRQPQCSPPDVTKLREPPGLRLPDNVEVEQQLLGSLLLRNAGYAEVRSIVVAEDFAVCAHQRIFDALAQLIEADERANAVTMAALFNTDVHAFPAEIPGRYLAELARCTVTLRDNRHLAVLLADLALRRCLMGELEDVRPCHVLMRVHNPAEHWEPAVAHGGVRYPHLRAQDGSIVVVVPIAAVAGLGKSGYVLVVSIRRVSLPR